MASISQETEFLKDGTIYQINVDITDPDDLVIEHVSIIELSKSADDPGVTFKVETELDPDKFVDSLTDDDWEQIKLNLGIYDDADDTSLGAED
jgi:hypothetical protein